MKTSMPLSRVPIFNGIDADLTGKASGAERVPGPLAEVSAGRARSVDPAGDRRVAMRTIMRALLLCAAHSLCDARARPGRRGRRARPVDGRSRVVVATTPMAPATACRSWFPTMAGPGVAAAL